MKEMWTGVYPNKKEYKYEVRFRTDEKAAYDHVVKACRDMIDGKPIDIKIEKMFQSNFAIGHSRPTDVWLKTQCDDNPQQIFKVTKENPKLLKFFDKDNRRYRCSNRRRAVQAPYH